MRRAILAVVVTLAWSACSSPPSTPAEPPAPGAGASTAPNAAFSVPADQLEHLTVALVRTVAWTTTLRTTGTVDWNNDQTTQAITQVSGPITRIVVDTGSHVKTGDPLLYVASSDTTNAISAYRKAKNRMALAQRNLDRSLDLLAHKAISQREMDSAQADFNDASTDVQTELDALRILGVSQQDIEDAERQNVPIRPELAMRAPLAGTVVQRMVLPGQVIQAGATAAFVITNTSTLWVQGHVYEKDLTAIHVGDKVEERNASFPQTFHGTVSYIGDLVDPATRTISVRIVTENQNSLLKKDLFLDVVISDKTTRDVLVVPTTAVLYDEQNFPFVYVQIEKGKFAQRQVTLGDQRGDDTQIVNGLKDSDPVVSQGSVFLQFANTYQ